MNVINLSIVASLAEEIRAILGDDDADAFWDTLDGETDVVDVIDTMLARLAEANAMSDAIAAQIADMRARKERMDRRAQAAKAALLSLLDAAGEKKIERPIATVSRRAGSVSVQITDDAAVPTQLCKIVRAPDKAAIKKQIEAGEAVPGAELVRGDDGVTVRFS